MECCGVPLERAVPRFFSWSDIADFASTRPVGSALARSLSPDTVAWVDGRRTAGILADVYDLLNALRHDFDVAHAKEGATIRKPRPYPRPWAKEESTTYGKDAIPVSEFYDWWNSGAGVAEGGDCK